MKPDAPDKASGMNKTKTERMVYIMKLGFNEATALECKGQSLLADMEMCEK